MVQIYPQNIFTELEKIICIWWELLWHSCTFRLEVQRVTFICDIYDDWYFSHLTCLFYSALLKVHVWDASRCFPLSTWVSSFLDNIVNMFYKHNIMLRCRCQCYSKLFRALSPLCGQWLDWKTIPWERRFWYMLIDTDQTIYCCCPAISAPLSPSFVGSHFCMAWTFYQICLCPLNFMIGRYKIFFSG